MKVCFAFFITLFCWAEVLVVEIPAPTFNIIENELKANDAAYMNVPGAPKLPCARVTLALPPGAIFESAEFRATRTYVANIDVPPCEPILPLMQNDALTIHAWNTYNDTHNRIYSSQNVYPQTYGAVISKGGLRKYTLVSVACYHFGYEPVARRLYYAPSVTVEIHYTMPHPESMRAKFWQMLKDDITVDHVAEKTIYNWHDAQNWYATNNGTRANGYLIVVPLSLSDAVLNLKSWKESQGLDVHIVTVEHIDLNGEGDDLEQKIRNYLRANLATTAYVLLVGTIPELPFRLVVPFNNDPDSPSNDPNVSPVPSDLYYAELTDHDSLSWNSDRDAHYGEVYNAAWQLLGEDDPDYHADVHLARIPFNDYNTIQEICDKLIAFDSTTDHAYKTGALLAGGMLFFENENYYGYPRIDGADAMELLMNNNIIDRGQAVTLYEKAGLDTSYYSCTDSLCRTTMKSYWNNKGIVFESNHGLADSYWRKVWAWDDGDGVPETNEITWPLCLHQTDVNELDNVHPATTWLLSCLCGKPESSTSLGPHLLHHGSSAVICATRCAYLTLDCQPMAYYFLKSLMQDTSMSNGVVGPAYDLARTTFMDLSTFWMNAYVYNFYGEPALRQFGRTAGIEECLQDIHRGSFSLYPNPTTGHVTVHLQSPAMRPIDITVYDATGRFIETIHSGIIAHGTENFTCTLPTGVYFVALRDTHTTYIKKLIVVK